MTLDQGIGIFMLLAIGCVLVALALIVVEMLGTR